MLKGKDEGDFMKLSTHILGLLVVFGAFTLIGCGNQDKSPQQMANQCIGAGNDCTQRVVSFCMTNPGACKNAAVAYNAAVDQQNPALPPNANGQPPQVLPLAQQVQQRAQNVAAAMKQSSANPMSSYYVDQSAQDIPARSAISEKLATMAVGGQSRQPASAPSSGESSAQDGNTIQ